MDHVLYIKCMFRHPVGYILRNGNIGNETFPGINFRVQKGLVIFRMSTWSKIFFTIPKRYNEIECFEQGPLVGNVRTNSCRGVFA